MQIGITAEEAEQKLQEKAALSTKKSEDKTDGEDAKKTEEDKTDEDNLPFHKHPRFLKLLEKSKVGDAAIAELAEIKKREAEQIKEAKKEFKLDPNMPFEEAIKLIKQEAAQEALELLKAESSQSNEKLSKAEELVNSGFDYLRDNGLKISSADEDAIAEIAVKNKINIESPEDMQIAYDIFDTNRKTAWTGKAKGDNTAIGNNRSPDEKKTAINYSQTSWSDFGNKIASKLWLAKEGF